MSSKGTPKKDATKNQRGKGKQSPLGLESLEIPPMQTTSYPGPVSESMSSREVEEHLGQEDVSISETMEREEYEKRQEQTKQKAFLAGLGQGAVIEGPKVFYDTISGLGYRDYHDFLEDLSDREKNYIDSQFEARGFDDKARWRKVVAMKPDGEVAYANRELNREEFLQLLPQIYEMFGPSEDWEGEEEDEEDEEPTIEAPVVEDRSDPWFAEAAKRHPELAAAAVTRGPSAEELT